MENLIALQRELTELGDYGEESALPSIAVVGGQEMKMGKFSRKDIISDLPQSIIEIILTKLPIKDAVRTSILSTKWKYQWAYMTQLVFDEKCVLLPFTKRKLLNFMMPCLLLHDGPIHKFKLSTPSLYKSPRIDQCLRFLSRNDLKELDLDVLIKDPMTPASSLIFSCHQITSLTLCGFVVHPPPKFRGFPSLKYLNLDCCTITLKDIEILISGSPLLESFKFSNDDCLALTVTAPNLKHITVDGTFKDVYLKHTPLLADISIDFFSEAWQGNVFVKLPITYNYLKFIEVKGVNYEEMNEVLYVHHLLLQSPNLQELQIEAAPIGYAHFNAADLDVWDKECPTDFKFKHLKIVGISYVSNEYDKKFIKFVLGRSPVLQEMSISLDDDCSREMNMVNEVLQFGRASPKVDINIVD